MAKKIEAVLTVVVTYSPATSAKAKCGTRISVRVAGVEVAYKATGGQWSQVQALKEWERNRKSFTMTENAEAFLRLAA